MFSGYLGEPELTVAAWRNLWFHTGDRGWFDDDGDLWFSDRLGDVVRRLGEMISSTKSSMRCSPNPDIRMAAVYGVPSDLIEEELMAAVVPQDGAALAPADVRHGVPRDLPASAVPRFVEFRDEPAATSTGKVEKFSSVPAESPPPPTTPAPERRRPR